MKKMLLSLMAMLFMCVMASAAQTVSGNVDNHEYVDLGLPSGTLWATCNVGATKPTEYGDLFAWGETSPKETFSYKTYKFLNKGLIKYNTQSKYGTVDIKTVLETQDDAASVNWGVSWRMPTEKEMKELRDGCEWEWTDNYVGSGVAGQIGKSKSNGNVIFLPAAGGGNDDGRVYEGSLGSYWSSSLYSGDPNYAYFLNFDSGDLGVGSVVSRYGGFSVRAVCPKK